jgi:hypothetical protein
MIGWKYPSFESLDIFQMCEVAVNQEEISRRLHISCFCCRMIFNSSHIQISVQQCKRIKNVTGAGHWWLTPIILATWEAEIKRLWFEASPDK